MQQKVLQQRQLIDREDSDLLKKIQRSDQKALASLYDRYAALLYPLGLRMTGSRETAEEIVIDVFAHVWEKGNSYAPHNGSVYAWLIALCRTKSFDKTRSTGQKKDGQEGKNQPHRGQQETEQKGAGSENILVMKGYTEEVRNSLKSISKLELRLLELSFHDGQSQSDLARMLRIPLGTIKAKMRRGIQKLRQTLAPEGA